MCCNAVLYLIPCKAIRRIPSALLIPSCFFVVFLDAVEATRKVTKQKMVYRVAESNGTHIHAKMEKFISIYVRKNGDNFDKEVTRFLIFGMESRIS